MHIIHEKRDHLVCTKYIQFTQLECGAVIFRRVQNWIREKYIRGVRESFVESEQQAYTASLQRQKNTRYGPYKRLSCGSGTARRFTSLEHFVKLT